MKKLIGVMLLSYFSNLAAEELQGFSERLKPLLACEEAVVKENSILSHNKTEIWTLVSEACAEQLKAAETACGMQPNHNADACPDLISDQLDQHYQLMLNKKPQVD